ncbi:MAG TPA: glycoside hydrolase family 43 protein [Epulopiscium sp.]|nr:glycoside hydrolase family 43 protein [Candidatus Epulonipiscium sp.]
MSTIYNQDYAGYLLVFFKTESESLFYAYSEDGLFWKELNQNQEILKATLGNKSIRDPHVIRVEDNTFKMISTDSWDSQNILAWDSKDLIHWENERLIPIAKKGSLNTWAPEVFYDDTEEKYMVFWSSSIDKYRDHRLYKAYTTDFIDFTEAEILFDPGYNVIDGTIVKDKDIYYLYFKDERQATPNEKSIKVATSLSAGTGYPGPTSPEAKRLTDTWVEGPILIKSLTEEKWYLYYDEYTRKRWGCSVSTDLINWTKLPYQDFLLPEGVRHGGIIPVTNNELSLLKKHF